MKNKERMFILIILFISAMCLLKFIISSIGKAASYFENKNIIEMNKCLENNLGYEKCHRIVYDNFYDCDY